MMPGYSDDEIRRRVLVWWILWAAILASLLVIYLVYAHGRPMSAGGHPSDLPLNLAGVVPLFISIVLRWLVLPRFTEANRAFVLFIAGIALAEMCGIFGIFLGGPYRDSLWVLGFLGVAQYVPFYARKLFDPKGSGFIPNN